MNKKLGLEVEMDMQVLTKLDIITIVKYLIELINSKAEIDEIDHLSNRRVRTVGEQLSSQFGVGLARMARTIRERKNVRDNEVFTPIDLINAKTLSSGINTFFVLVSASGSLTVICCVVVTFLDGSYVKPVNSNDILGNVIATDLFKFGDCSNLAKNFPIGP